VERVGDALDVEWVDQERACRELGGRARELREDEDAVSVDPARAVLLAHEVHAVLQGRDQRDVGRPVVSREAHVLETAVDVVDGSPASARKLPVDLADQPLDHDLVVAHNDVLAARHDDLK
jgi:hypothetical protein